MRTVGGVFCSDQVVPEPLTGSILTAEEISSIRRVALTALRGVPLRSPVTTGEPPFSRFLDIYQDGDVWHPALYAILVPILSRVSALGLLAARMPEHMPMVPSRIFVNQYPEGHQSGMRVHRDSMVVYCAVTVVVTTDTADGSFFVASATGVKRLVPLAAGWAVTVHPDTYHGVEDAVRSGDRISFTFFY